MVRAFAHGVMGHQNNPHGGPIELFLIQPVSTTSVTKAVVCAVLSVCWYI